MRGRPPRLAGTPHFHWRLQLLAAPWQLLAWTHRLQQRHLARASPCHMMLSLGHISVRPIRGDGVQQRSPTSTLGCHSSQPCLCLCHNYIKFHQLNLLPAFCQMRRDADSCWVTGGGAGSYHLRVAPCGGTSSPREDGSKQWDGRATALDTRAGPPRGSTRNSSLLAEVTVVTPNPALTNCVSPSAPHPVGLLVWSSYQQHQHPLEFTGPHQPAKQNRGMGPRIPANRFCA